MTERQVDLLGSIGLWKLTGSVNITLFFICYGNIVPVYDFKLVWIVPNPSVKEFLKTIYQREQNNHVLCFIHKPALHVTVAEHACDDASKSSGGPRQVPWVPRNL